MLYIRPMDIVVLILALASLLPLYSWYWPGAASGTVMIISPNANWQLDLQQNQYFDVEGALGVSRLEINNGKIRFISSPCRGKYCIHAGWQQFGGAVAACMPNQVMLQVNITSEMQFDAISF
jgi:hypothetical protein